MPTTHKENIKSFIASSILNSLKKMSYQLWEADKDYTNGTIVVHNNIKYIATTSGNSGALPPVHISGVAIKGGISWLYVESISVSNTFDNLYMSIGKSLPWANENIPTTPLDSDKDSQQVLNDVVTAIRVEPNSTRIAIRRYNWTSGVIYSQYDSEKTLDGDIKYTTPFYVINNEFNIYKCLSNNDNSQSVQQPSGTSINVIQLSDGYTWKYVGTVNPSDVSSFSTSGYIPVEKKNTSGTPQYDVQQNAKNGELSGFKIISKVGSFNDDITVSLIDADGTGATASGVVSSGNLKSLYISAPGQNYTKATAIVKNTSALGSGALATATLAGGVITGITIDNAGSGYSTARVIIIGDGTGAAATATISSNQISNINITSGGSGYTYAKVYVIAGSAGAIADAIIAPIGGHGADIASELNASAIIVSVKLTSTDSSDFLLVGEDSDFRQIALLTNVVNSNNISPASKYIVGQSHPLYGTKPNAVKLKSALPIYVNNIKSVTRDSNVEQDIKIVIAL